MRYDKHFFFCVRTGSESRGPRWKFDLWSRQSAVGGARVAFEALIIVQVTQWASFFLVTGLRCTPISAETHGLQHPPTTNPWYHTFNHTHTDPPQSVSLTSTGGPLRLLHPRDSPWCEFLHVAICPIYTFRTAFILATKSLISSLPDNTCWGRQAGACVGGEAEARGCITLLIFSFGCVSSAGKWLRASQLSTTWVCSSVPVTMFPTALKAAVWMWRGSVKNV